MRLPKLSKNELQEAHDRFVIRHLIENRKKAYLLDEISIEYYKMKIKKEKIKIKKNIDKKETKPHN